MGNQGAHRCVRSSSWARQLHIPRPTPTYKRCFGHHTVQGRVMEGIRVYQAQFGYTRPKLHTAPGQHTGKRQPHGAVSNGYPAILEA